MFSVVIPLYNKELSIENTLSSVLSQSFQNFEIIIVNDGSTDNSLKVVKSIRDPRIRIIDKQNGGVSSARNRGIEESKFEWVCFLDGDDLWMESHLDTVFRMILDFPKDKVFCTSFIRSTENLSLVNKNNSVVVIEDYFQEAIKEYFFWTSVVVINKDVFKKVGIFRTDINRGEDLDLWIRIGRLYRFIRSNRVTGVYVQDSENKLTKSRYNYSKSLYADFHLRIERFDRKTEKKYYNKLLTDGFKAFILRSDYKNALRTLYRLLMLNFIKINNEKSN